VLDIFHFWFLDKVCYPLERISWSKIWWQTQKTTHHCKINAFLTPLRTETDLSSLNNIYWILIIGKKLGDLIIINKMVKFMSYKC